MAHLTARPEMKVLFLHALPLDRRMWDEAAKSLPYEAVAPDLYPLGESIEDWANALIGQLEGEYWLPLFSVDTPRPIVAAAKALAMEQDIGEIVTGVRAFHDRQDLAAFAASWRRPLIGISGDEDTAPPPWKVQQLASGQGRSFQRVAGSGHYVNLEQPGAFSAILTTAIGSITGESYPCGPMDEEDDGEQWEDAEEGRSVICSSCGVSSLPPETPGDEALCENPNCEAFGEPVS